MANFSVSAIEPHLLEKVIQKLDFKSYYRLQRTCSKISEFIRTTSSISIWNSRRYFLSYSRVSCSWKCSIYVSPKEYQVKGIFGLRVGVLNIAPDNEEEDAFLLNKPDRVKSLCAFLKKHQITCTELVLPADSGITKNEYKTVLNIVKPETVELMTEDNDLYEALLDSKSGPLERVELNVDQADFVKILNGVLPIFTELSLTVTICNGTIPLIQSILTMLADPLPILREFLVLFHYDHSSDPFCKEEMDEMFANQKMTIGKDDDGDDCAFIELPSHFPKGSTCKYGKDSFLCGYFIIHVANRGSSKRQKFDHSLW